MVHGIIDRMVKCLIVLLINKISFQLSKLVLLFKEAQIMLSFSNYINLFKEVFGFLKNPDLKNDFKFSKKQRIINILMLIVINITLSLPFLFLTLLFLGEDVLKNHTVIVAMEKSNPIIVIMLMVLMIPFVEELTFRLFLKFKPQYFCLSVFLLVQSFGGLFLGSKENFGFIILGVPFLLGLTAFILSMSNKEEYSKFWEKNIRYILYFSIISFGIIHVSNFKETTSPILLMIPIIIFPQLLMGTILGFLRIKYGFIYSFIYHALNNFIPLTFVLLGNLLEKLYF